jgi:hypothetical protein
VKKNDMMTSLMAFTTLNTNEVQVAHFQPGRVRLKIPAIRRRTPEAEAMASALRRIPGIKTIDVNPVTTSVLITYDVPTFAAEATQHILRGVLKEHFPALDTEQVLERLTGSVPNR